MKEKVKRKQGHKRVKSNRVMEEVDESRRKKGEEPTRTKILRDIFTNATFQESNLYTDLQDSFNLIEPFNDLVIFCMFLYRLITHT